MEGANTNTVVIAVDNSDFAERAFNFYLSDLHVASDNVILVHCAELSNVSARSHQQLPYPDWQNILDQEKASIDRLREKYTKKCSHYQIIPQFEVVHTAHPGEAIVQAAASREASHVVVGTRGLGTIRRTILGSISDYVLHHAKCPVIIVRQ